MTISTKTVKEIAETMRYAIIKRPETKEAIKCLGIEFCDIFARELPRFDRNRFLSAITHEKQTDS